MAEALVPGRVFVIRRYPIRYFVIPKTGCTFVKNFLWKVETEATHSAPLRIHDYDQNFLRAADVSLSLEAIRNENYAFTVVRRPRERFLSLYTDKIIGRGRELFPPVAELLNKQHGLDLSPVTASDHRRNLEILLDWLERNIVDGVDLPRDPHWMPQMTRESEIKSMRLHFLITSELQWQLPFFLRDLVPNIQKYMTGIERNASRGVLDPREIVQPSLQKRINALYHRDKAVFQMASERWAQIRTGIAHDIPRAGHD